MFSNIIERVIKLLSGHGRSVRPIPISARHLTQRIVGVNPVRTIGQGGAGSLIGVVIRIGVGNRREASGTGLGGDGGQPIQIIVGLGGGQAHGGIGFENNLTHQRRVGKVTVSRVVDAVAHGLQTRGVVVGIRRQRQARRAVEHGKIGAPQQRVVTVRDGEAVQRPAGVAFPEQLARGVVSQRADSAAVGHAGLAPAPVIAVGCRSILLLVAQFRGLKFLSDEFIQTFARVKKCFRRS